METSTRDVFLSHASVDKERYVRPVAAELQRRQISYWLDEAEIRWGDAISTGINAGLETSRFVVVFLSDAFIEQSWTLKELGAAISNENEPGKVVVLPIIIGDPKHILRTLPLLRDKAYVQWEIGIQAIADRLAGLLDKRMASSAATLERQIPELQVKPIGVVRIIDLFPLAVIDENHQRVRSMDRNREWRGETTLDVVLNTVNEGDRQFVLHLYEEYARRRQSNGAAILTERPSDGTLEIVSLGMTGDAELDLQLRNLGNQTAYISRFTVRILECRGRVLPALQPSAKYLIPIDGLVVGDARELDVSHVLTPHSADRVLIALDLIRFSGRVN